MNSPLSRLRHHVSGAIARGESEAITEQTSVTPSHVYVVINRTTGFIYGVSFSLDRAQHELTEAKRCRDALGRPDDVVCISHEPILPRLDQGLS